MKVNEVRKTVKTVFGKYENDTEDQHASTLHFSPLAKNSGSLASSDKGYRVFFSAARKPLGLLIDAASPSHTHTLTTLGSNSLDSSNLQSQQASSRRPSPLGCARIRM